MLSELAIALALVFVIEGVLYALFPAAMQRMLAQVFHPVTAIPARRGTIFRHSRGSFCLVIKKLRINP
jgi:hypothetical protein